MHLARLRAAYHQEICREIVRLQNGKPNFADKSSKASVEIASKLLSLIGCQPQDGPLPGQTTGKRFEETTRTFLAQAFAHLQHIRPGRWQYETGTAISQFQQYEHLAELDKLITLKKMLASVLGTEHIIKPDIIIARLPLAENEINARENFVQGREFARFSSLRAENNPAPILHASISCKWTLRNDRSQNARSEALNLIRHRKGHTPHIVAVTAEPMPTRIAALALGTGDLDCVYHFALYELEEAIAALGNEDQMDMLQTLIQGNRLRDISDLPLDLAI